CPGFFARFFVGRIRIVGGFAGAHEAVASAFIGDRIVSFTGGFHGGGGVGDCGIDARVISAIEAVYRSFDSSHCVFCRRRAVKNKSSSKVAAIGGEAKSLSATPAKSRHKEFSARGRKFLGVIGGRVQIGG